jgi:hypothetical protein
MAGVWNNCLLDVGRGETHVRRHHCPERRFTSSRQRGHGEFARGEIGLAVESILSKGRKLGEARTDRSGHGIERRIVLALCLINAFGVERELVPEAVEIDALALPAC